MNNHTTASIGSRLVQAGSITGGVHLYGTPSPVPVPRQLPAVPHWFTGRAKELATLTAVLDAASDSSRTVVISAIRGTGGIGKTWLAVHWARQHAEHFPDGQLFVDLQGFSPTGEAKTPASALRGFLVALGVDPAGIPLDVDAQVGLYRSLVAARRMLIVLDNARDTAQVLPLLPGGQLCTVVVTSRNRLDGLVTNYGAYSLPLDVLNQTDARNLLASRLGQARLDAEPEAVDELLAYCEVPPETVDR